MALKFFHIGKANARIEELETKVAALEAEAKTATENATAVSEQAETLSAELTQVKADLTTAKQTISTLTARAEKAEAEAKDAKEKLANPSEEIKIRASQEALKITQAQGQPPVDAKAGADSKDVLAQWESIKDPAEKAVFYRKNKSAIFQASRNLPKE